MAKNTTPQQVADKWSRGVQNGSQSYSDGVNAVTTSPGQKAAAQMSVWLANVQASAPIWQAAMQSMDLGFWKQRCVSKGANNLRAAATDAKPAVLAFHSQWDPFIRQAAASLPPRGDYNANKGRMSAMADIAHQAKGRFRARQHVHA